MSIGAFFDLDGTLLAPPSLELRFFWHMLAQAQLKPASCARWLARHILNRAAHFRWDPAERVTVIHSNKHWLAGIRESAAHSWACQYAAHASYFPAGVAQVSWHLAQSHKVFIVTGGLAPIVRKVIAPHPILRNAEICATELEVAPSGVFTGRTRSAAIAGREKARAVVHLAELHNIDLAQSFAYANSSDDRWFLAGIRRAFAVNPDRKLAALARTYSWPVLRWTRENQQEMRLGFESAHPIIGSEMERN
jgi:alcohol-forming fatty acyl-CoA reductase